MSDLVIETERLLLRKFRESDFPDYEKLCANPDVMRYLGNMVRRWRHTHLR